MSSAGGGETDCESGGPPPQVRHGSWTGSRGWFDGWRSILDAPVSSSSLAAFRVLFGLLNLYGAVRFLANGWVDRFFVRPDNYLPYWGLEWLVPLNPAGMYVVFGAMVVTSLMIALGAWYRAAVVLHFLLFTYVELLDVTNYLNHYYLVSVLSFWMIWLPASSRWSVDVWRGATSERLVLPAWPVLGLRVQLSLVYFYAGLAKLNSDWLVHAQPLNLWLSARTETPVIGPWLDSWWVALLMSWGGFLFDLTVWVFLWWPRTTLLAWLVVLVFHGVTGSLFMIGMFPWIMVTGTTVFFAFDWPERLGRRFGWVAGVVGPDRLGERPEGRFGGDGAALGLDPGLSRGAWEGARWRVLARGVLVLLLLVQVLLPLRGYVGGGVVNWHEQGMRWSWRVMVREKNGSVTYRVHSPSLDRTWLESPSRYLTDQQEREMAGQPDLILQVAHWVARDYRARGVEDVQVYVDAWVSWNGRRPARLIEPDVDLVRVRRSLFGREWISEAPAEAPPRLERMR